MENKDTLETVMETVANAVGDQEFSLPLMAWQKGNAESEKICADYEREVETYQKVPVSPCNKVMSRKLLKRFYRKDFRDFWTSPIAEYLPAVSEGMMKLCETVYPHDEAICYAKALIATLSVKELAKDFLYGVAHQAPEYLTALAAYYYIKNLPVHEFEKKYVGSVVGKDGELEDRYNENRCEICGYQHTVSAEPKMRFWHINMDMANFYFNGRMSRSSLNTAIIFLEEYKKLPRPEHSKTDYEHFQKIIDVIDHTPENMTSGKLRRELKQSGLLPMTRNQIENFIDILGYLDILHPEDSHGMVYIHTPEKDMLDSLSFMGYAAHPVNRWTRRCGIDDDTLKILFDDIYEKG